MPSVLDEQRRRRARVVRLCAVVTLSTLGVLAGGRVLEAVRDFTQPTELTYPNSTMVFHAREFAAGRPIYRDFRSLPHLVAPYGPLAYAVPGMVGRWLDANELLLLRIGRTFSLVCTLGSGFIVLSLLLRREHAGWLAAGVSTLMFLTADIMWPVSICFRPDAAETFFVLLGVAVFAYKGRSRWSYVAIPCFAVAFLFKQSAIVAPAAVVLFLVLRRRPRQAAAFALCSGAVYGAAFLVANWVSDGRYYLNCFRGLTANVTPQNIVTVAGARVLIRCPIPFALAAVGIGRRWAGRSFDLYGVLCVSCFCVATAATIRDGSEDNYFLKTLAFACLIAGRELTEWMRGTPNEALGGGTMRHASSAPSGRWNGRARPHAGLALAAPILMMAYFVPKAGLVLVRLPDRARAITARTERDDYQRSFLRDHADFLNALGGPVLCQYDPLNLLLEKPLAMDTYMLAGLADQQVLDDSSLIDMIRNRQVAAVVLQFPMDLDPIPKHQSTAKFRRAWIDAMAEAGYRQNDLKTLYIYEPPR